MNRKRFVKLSALAAAGLAAGCDSRGPEAAHGLLRAAERSNERLERALFRPGARSRPPGSETTGMALPAYHISPSVPVWDAAVRGPWALEVDGAVRRPLRLTLAQLMELPSVTQRVSHYCVEGWTAVTRWTGVRLRTLAELAEPMAGADYVDFQSFDAGYHESWDRASALHPQTLVAYGYDGHMLPAAYGAPARLHSPVKLGYKNVKYLTRILFMPERNGGYWSDRGYEWYAGT